MLGTVRTFGVPQAYNACRAFELTVSVIKGQRNCVAGCKEVFYARVMDKMGTAGRYVNNFHLFGAETNFQLFQGSVPFIGAQIAGCACGERLGDYDREASADRHISFANFRYFGLKAAADMPVSAQEVCYQNDFVYILVRKRGRNLQKNNSVVLNILNGGRSDYTVFDDDIDNLSD